MISLLTLWMPILLSAVIVFVASSVIHMALPWHKSDYPKMPNEDKFIAAVSPLAIPPGDYFVPRAAGMAEMKTPDFAAKLKKGPVVVMTVMPNEMMGMGRSLTLWFLYSVVIGFFSAYIASRTLAPGVHYLKVFQIVGATAFMGYVAALWQMSIWFRRAWSTTIKATIDGLLYAMLTAGTFGWLWPR